MTKLKSNKVQSAKYNNTGIEEMIDEQDDGIRKISLNFKTEKDFEDFILKTGLVELMNKSNVVFKRPGTKSSIDKFF